MRRLTLLLLILVSLSCCASSSGYVDYVLDVDGHALRAVFSPKDDKSEDTCKPDQANKDKCYVMYKEEFYKKETELLELRLWKKSCQADPSHC